jgi:hypothetical protein
MLLCLCHSAHVFIPSLGSLFQVAGYAFCNTGLLLFSFVVVVVLLL